MATKRQRCPECNKLFVRLSSHMRVHQNEVEEQVEEQIEVQVEEQEQVLEPGSRVDGPVVDSSHVVEILDDNRHTPTHWHCRCSDGTTRHVDRRLF